VKLKLLVLACVAGLAVNVASADSYAGMKLAEMQAQIHALQNQVNHMSMSSGSSSSKGGMMSGMAGLVTLNQPISQIINSDANATGQTLALLNASTQGKIAHGLTLGGMMQGDLFWARTNAVGSLANGGIEDPQAAFANPYLDAQNSTARNRTAVTLTNIRLSAVASFNQWANGILQFGDNYLGQTLNGNVHNGFTYNNNNIIVQQAYLLIGNLSQSPLYGFVGKKYIDFGQFQNVNVFTQPLTRQFFQANGNTVGIGMVSGGFDVAVSAMNGGAHDNVLYSTNNSVSQNIYTPNNAMINNFAVSVGYGMKNKDGFDWHVGAGFLNGGATAIAKKQTSTAVTSNSVADVNARLSMNNIDFYAEYLTSLSDAATYDNITTPTYKAGGRSQGWQVAGDYKFSWMGHKSMFGLSYSAVKAVGNSNASYNQIVTSVRQEAMKNVWVGVEYAYQDGVPIVSGVGTDIDNHSGTTNNTVTLDLTAYF
jgi:hypothetical protein